MFLFFIFTMGIQLSVISGFRGVVDQICFLLGYFAASNGNSLPAVRVRKTAEASHWLASAVFLMF
jgi:hypothetical protein